MSCSTGDTSLHDFYKMTLMLTIKCLTLLFIISNANLTMTLKFQLIIREEKDLCQLFRIESEKFSSFNFQMCFIFQVLPLYIDSVLHIFTCHLDHLLCNSQIAESLHKNYEALCCNDHGCIPDFSRY